MKCAIDKQVGGNHYKHFNIQPVDFIHQNHLEYIDGCIIKYVCRFRAKNGLEDLEKIKHYVDLLIEFEYSQEHTDCLPQPYITLPTPEHPALCDNKYIE